MNFCKILFAALVAMLVSACVGAGPVGNASVPQPAKSVDLERYLGRWYEYARYEAPFQRDCEAVTADYSRNEDGSIRVLNTCRQGAVDGPAKASTGRAKVVDTVTGAKLKVSFFGPFYGDYWVMDRADDYRWAIVGEPSGRYLWILTREARPDAATGQMLIAHVRSMGYDTRLLRMTAH